jgi:succinoglycan biosynthesis transport protein ExoP
MRSEGGMGDSVRDGKRFEEYWRVVWHRKWVIGLTVVATLLAVVVGNHFLPRIYEASSTLYIKEQMPSVLRDTVAATGFTDLTTLEEINTQMEIVRSRSLLEEVIGKLGLENVLAADNGLPEGERLQLTIDALRKQLTVSSILNTRLIRVAVRSRDPGLAMRIDNEISRSFIDRNVGSKRSEANAVLAFVSGQVDEVSSRLDKAEEDLLRYKQSHRIADISEEAKLKLDRLSDLESHYEEAKMDRQILATRIAAAMRLASPDAAQAGPPLSPAVTALQDRLTEAERRLAQLPPGDSREKRLRADTDSLKRQIQAAMGGGPAQPTSVNSVLQLQIADYRYQDIILAAQEEAFRGLIDANEADVNTLSAQDISLARLERTRRINDDLYSELVKSRNEAQIEAVSQLGNIDIIDPAVMPVRPVSPNKQENLIIGLLLSIVLGICLAFLLDHFDTIVTSEEEIKKLLAAPLLGYIPRFHQNGRAIAKKTGDLIPRNPLFTRDEPRSPASEAFRLLRTNLFFIELDKGLKTIAVTSAVPGEGKTVIAVNLAAALAVQEEKVLIVDADFRAPAVHRVLLLPQTPGFTDIFVNHLSIRSVVREVEGLPNLSVITAGRIPPNPAEITGSARMRQLIEEFRGSFDRIVFDGPPVLGATDAVVLASSVDGVLVVLRKGKIDRRAVRRMSEILDHTRVTILGGVLNGIDKGDGGYGYGYGYYYPGNDPQE